MIHRKFQMYGVVMFGMFLAMPTVQVSAHCTSCLVIYSRCVVIHYICVVIYCIFLVMYYKCVVIYYMYVVI